jgi:hypothetical protein
MFKTFTFPPNSKRKYLEDAIKEVCGHVSSGASFSLDIPPRSGKSNIIYASAYEMVATGVSPWAIVISPWLFLRDQICDADKLDDHIDFYKVSGPIVTSDITDFANYKFWDIKNKDERPHIWSATLSVCHKQIDGLKRAVLETIETIGKPPVIYIDESQILGDEKTMSSVYDTLIGAGAYVVTLTGTFYRRDKRPIKGANLEAKKISDNVALTVRRRLDPKQVQEIDYTGTTTVYEQTADLSVSWKTAWEVGALARINGKWINSKLNGTPISQCSKSGILPGSIRAVLESPECVEEYAKQIIDDLAYAKSFSPKSRNAAAMVVVGSDIADRHGEKEANRHAKQVKSALDLEAKRRGKSYKVCIITMAADDENAGVDDLAAFRKGTYDIIIVKMMGLVGLDVKRLKVLAIMSTLRNGPLLAQMITRNLTVWDEVPELIPRTIMLEDPFMVEAFANLVTKQGGEAKASDFEQVDQRVIDVDQQPKEEILVGESWASGHIDENLTAADGDHTLICRFIRAKFAIARNMTDAEIVVGVSEGALPFSAEELETFKKSEAQPPVAHPPKARNLKSSIQDEIDKFNELTSQYAGSKFSYAGSPNEWRECRAAITSKAKAKAGIAGVISTERNLSKIKAASAFIEGMING